jgi:hypothetical protein
VLLITTLIQLDPTDISHSFVNTTIWSSLEPCLGIVMSCLPVLQPTVAKIFGEGTLAWARRPSKTSTAPGMWPHSVDRRPLQATTIGNGNLHRLYDVGNLLGSCHSSVPSLTIEVGRRTWPKPEGQGNILGSKSFNSSKDWHVQQSLGTSARLRTPSPCYQMGRN